jgi:hypothetical protein
MFEFESEKEGEDDPFGDKMLTESAEIDDMLLNDDDANCEHIFENL